MNETTFDLTPEEAKRLEAELDGYLAEMDEITRHLASNRREIDRLRAETRARLSIIEEMLRPR